MPQKSAEKRGRSGRNTRLRSRRQRLKKKMDEKYKRSLRTEAKRGNLFIQNLLSAQQVTKRETGREGLQEAEWRL